MNGESSGLTGSDALAISTATDAGRNAGYGYPAMPMVPAYGYGGNGMFGGMNDGMWIFALLLLGRGGFWGGDGCGNGGFVTQADLSNALANQTTQSQLQSLAVETANNNYETAQLINSQTNTLLETQNTNLVNAIQGFNSLGMQITNQTNVLAQSIAQLSAKLDSCCCEIKTQMLEDRLEDSRARNVELQNDISNFNQSQYLLSQFGRFVPWLGTGQPTASQSGTAA